MKNLLVHLFLLLANSIFSQSIELEGYTYEKGNRGYLAVVEVQAIDPISGKIISETFSEKDGHFSLEVPSNESLKLHFYKDMFEAKEMDLKTGATKQFLKVEMERSSGYYFDITLAEKKINPLVARDAIKGARIEVYNNTTQEPILELQDHPDPEFRINLKKGNHYTILVRKDGFLSKRMEAMVNVEECLLCFEGIGKINPGVSDNLTEGNEYGVLLANVEMERVFEGKKMEIKNLYYDLNKWNLKKAAKKELNKVIVLMNDNPNLELELGSHTDSRASNEFNMELSKKRAKSAVDYLISRGIPKERIISAGYGETQIINGCVDGVVCTEEEHAKNRRTELKILGITDTAEEKSLAQMKKEEQEEALIKELMNQETVTAEELEKIKQKDKPMDMPALPPVLNLESVNGYKIIVKQSYDILEKDHEIYQEFPNVEVAPSGLGSLYYMIGGFKNTSETLEYFNKHIANKYKGSFVARFDKGIMTKIDQ